MRLLAVFLSAVMCLSAITVTMREYDQGRSGANTSETVLTRSNLSAGQFGLLHICTLDGPILAAPLVSGGLTIYATMANSIYAMTEGTCAQVWKTTVATPGSFPTQGGYLALTIGCLSTPTINASLGVIYALCMVDNGGGASTGTWKLFSLNVADGTTYHAPVTVSLTASAVNFGNDSGQLGRPGLLSLNGEVYIGFGSFLPGTEQNQYFGWMAAYNATTLALDYTYCSACASSGNGGGIWMAGGGISADSSGNLCVITGNGSWNGTSQLGESFIKLDSHLNVLDFFTPTNWATLNTNDTDLGSSRCMFLDDTHAVGAGKDGRLWLLDMTNMGHLQNGGVGPIQTFTPDSDVRNYFVYANSTLFIGSSGNNEAGGPTHPFRAYSFSSTFNTTPTATSSVVSAYGYGMAYSSNGASDGILWVTTTPASAFNTLRSGTLYALRSDTLAVLWSSGTYGNIAKFVPTVIANGKVYVETHDSTAFIWGILPTVQQGGRRRDARHL